MIYRQILMLTIIAALCAVFICPPSMAASKKIGVQGIHWSDSYEEALTQSRENGKKIYLLFYTNYCPMCARMDSSTLADPDVVSYLNKNFVSVRVDANAQGKLAAKYGVTGVPASFLLAGDEKRLVGFLGFREADFLLTVLKFVKTESKLSFSEFRREMKR